MVVLNSRISTNPLSTPSPYPLFSHKFSWKTPSTLSLPLSRNLPLLRAFSLHLLHPLPSTKFQISAHLRRPTNSRQNHLRKKRLQQLQQVNPVPEFDKSDVNESNSVDSGEERLSLDEKRSSLDEKESSFDSFSDINNHGFAKELETESKRKQFGESNSVNSSEKRLSLDDQRSSIDKKESSFDTFSREKNDGFAKELETESKRKQFGESIMWNKLESWVEQYKKDSEFWGIGTGPIFTVFQDSEGEVERVEVNEDEILKRSRVDPRLVADSETEELAEVSYKLSFAKDLAREMESGSNVIPKNSSVTKFVVSGREEVNMQRQSKVEKSGFKSMVGSLVLKPGLFPRISKVGVGVLCGLLVVWAIKGLFGFGKDRKEHTRLEEEMLKRKMKARAEKEKMVIGNVEVMQDAVEPKSVPFTRPQLDKKELLNKIAKVKGSNSELAMVEHFDYKSKEFVEKIEEIRAMAREAREIEKRESAVNDGDGDGDGEDDQDMEAFSSDGETQENNHPTDNNERYVVDSDVTTESSSLREPSNDIGQNIDETLVEVKETTPDIVIPNGYGSSRPEVIHTSLATDSSSLNKENLHFDNPSSPPGLQEKSLRKNFKIIKSAKEAREYLTRKNIRPEISQESESIYDDNTDVAMTRPGENLAGQTLQVNAEVVASATVDSSYPSEGCSKDNNVTKEGNIDTSDYLETSGPEVCVSNHDFGESALNVSDEEETGDKESQEYDCAKDVTSSLPNSTSTEVDHGDLIEAEALSSPIDKHGSEDFEDNEQLIDLQVPEMSLSADVKDRSTEQTSSTNEGRWIEKNFHEVEPIFEKISAGFRDNYLSARDKANLDSRIELSQLTSDGDERELEWMKDEKLREIVFKVRDNELSGRDPFHLMTEDDKCAFFSGLEKKIELENENLKNLHEYFHSNIENLDYGADGISLYDPPDKFIPRWKVPPAEKSPEFLNKFIEQRETAVAESLKNSLLAKNAGDGTTGPLSKENAAVTSQVSDKSLKLQKDPKPSSKTIIEGSDGSVRAGKKSGREYWEHTKKWSQEFLESYNAETDLEVKSVMKDIGKDLDRWITEKEIKEAAELMDKLPEKGQKFIKGKLEKVRREMELFGPQAVVSKYREYAEEKEEDYLWWLDLPCVLCVELYTVEDGEQRVGFYSLEMAADLELDPKPFHVIAFEDAGDCKNLCYIIQAKMEMLGNGNAFVVARPPKDAFREAKANGFGVTVIRKGQLQLNVDQTSEEVEELIVEIGSKIYHDKIMKERGVDINGLMKGVFGFGKPAKSGRRRSKRKLKRRTKK